MTVQQAMLRTHCAANLMTHVLDDQVRGCRVAPALGAQPFYVIEGKCCVLGQAKVFSESQA